MYQRALSLQFTLDKTINNTAPVLSVSAVLQHKEITYRRSIPNFTD